MRAQGIYQRGLQYLAIKLNRRIRMDDMWPVESIMDYTMLAVGTVLFVVLVGFRLYYWHRSLESSESFYEASPIEGRNRWLSLKSLARMFWESSLDGTGLGYQPRNETIGLDASAIENLPTFSFNGGSRDLYLRENIECSVCLEEFKEGEKCRLLPTCDHCFHAECIDMWFFTHTTCPLCRSEVASSLQSTLAATQAAGSPESPTTGNGPQNYPHLSSFSDRMGASSSGTSGTIPSSQPYFDLELGENSRGPQISETAGTQFQEDGRSAVQLSTTGDNNSS